MLSHDIIVKGNIANLRIEVTHDNNYVLPCVNKIVSIRELHVGIEFFDFFLF